MHNTVYDYIEILKSLTKEPKEKGYTGINRSTGRGINAPSIVAFFFQRKP